MTDHFGSCLCGTVRFEVQGEFQSFYLCHCQHCRKDTGSAHAANLFAQSAKLKWVAGTNAVTFFPLLRGSESAQKSGVKYSEQVLFCGWIQEETQGCGQRGYCAWVG